MKDVDIFEVLFFGAVIALILLVLVLIFWAAYVVAGAIGVFVLMMIITVSLVVSYYLVAYT